jgi:DNA-binding FadR family transcriptional regulator
MLAPRKADEVAQDLLDRIVSGEIPPGAVLPREADLAERYKVNRSVVREANKLLEVHRLVRPTRRRGTVVLDPLRSVTPAVLRAMLAAPRGRLDRKVLRDLLEVRAALDVMMCRLAAANRTKADLAALEAVVDAIEKSEPGSEASLEAIVELSVALARASKNRVLEMLVHWHADVSEVLRPILRHVQAMTAARGVHRALVAAVAAREADAAAEMVAAFHAWAIPQFIQAAEEMKDAAPRRRSKKA